MVIKKGVNVLKTTLSAALVLALSLSILLNQRYNFPHDKSSIDPRIPKEGMGFGQIGLVAHAPYKMPFFSDTNIPFLF